MPSATHQDLLLWALRKMTADGYLPVASDGAISRGGFWNLLPTPAQTGHFRPDAYGINAHSGALAFGEAKIASDIATVHTLKQLSTFGRLFDRSQNDWCKLYVAVPRSAALLLDRTLAKAGLLGNKHVFCMYVPDCMVGAK